jgi:hypothetical protein
MDLSNKINSIRRLKLRCCYVLGRMGQVVFGRGCGSTLFKTSKCRDGMYSKIKEDDLVSGRHLGPLHLQLQLHLSVKHHWEQLCSKT